MKTKAEQIREEAETILKNNPTLIVHPVTEIETLKLVHELEVYQIELEMMLEMMDESISNEIKEEEKRVSELLVASKELLLQNDEKTIELGKSIIANKKLPFLSKAKTNRATALVVANY
jgi:predicted DNA-binding protein (UPF0251 family)